MDAIKIKQSRVLYLYRPTGKVGSSIVRTVDTEKLAPSNDAQHRRDYRAHTVRKLLTIIVMLGVSGLLVWNFG